MKIATTLLAAVLLTGCGIGVGADISHPLNGRHENASNDVRDIKITREVRERLLKDPKVSGLDIEVNTYEGVVTLKGSVDSIEEGEQAVRVAGEVPGVSEVHSKLALR